MKPSIMMNIDSSIVVDEDDLKFQHFVVDVELDVIIIYQSIVAVVVVPKDNVVIESYLPMKMIVMMMTMIFDDFSY